MSQKRKLTNILVRQSTDMTKFVLGDHSLHVLFKGATCLAESQELKLFWAEVFPSHSDDYFFNRKKWERFCNDSKNGESFCTPSYDRDVTHQDLSEARRKLTSGTKRGGGIFVVVVCILYNDYIMRLTLFCCRIMHLDPTLLYNTALFLPVVDICYFLKFPSRLSHVEQVNLQTMFAFAMSSTSSPDFQLHQLLHLLQVRQYHRCGIVIVLSAAMISL